MTVQQHSENEWTAGEWIVNPFNAQVDCGKPSRRGGLLPVCQMLWPTDERSEAETEANARLIAAAPCMVKGLAHYADQLCEGWCEGAAELANFEDCGGCLAKRLCAKAQGQLAKSAPSHAA